MNGRKQMHSFAQPAFALARGAYPGARYAMVSAARRTFCKKLSSYLCLNAMRHSLSLEHEKFKRLAARTCRTLLEPLIPLRRVERERDSLVKSFGVALRNSLVLNLPNSSAQIHVLPDCLHGGHRR
jgi:hypothetical protein